MGLVLFILLAGSEIALAVWSCTKGKEKKAFRRNRLIVSAAELLIVLIARLLPFGQQWRLMPALLFLAAAFVISLLIMLVRRKKEDGLRKTGGIVVSCILHVLLFGFLLVPAFLFTGYKGLPLTGTYRIGETSAILIDHSRQDSFLQDGSFSEVPVHFYYPLTEEADTEKFPLVIFSHGAFGYYQSNTSTYSELASHGYVVVSLDHPHHAFFTKNTDGKLVTVDPEFLNDAIAVSNSNGSDNDAEAYFKLYQEWMALRTADMNFALDEIKDAADAGRLDDSWFLQDGNEEVPGVLKKTDTARIGLMGHSMGGATSVELGRERQDIAAVIDIDGTMLGEYTGVRNGIFEVREEAYEVPLLEFSNWRSYQELAESREEYRAKGEHYPNDEVMRHAAAGFITTVRGTEHMDFTDLPLLSPVLGRMLGSGERDTKETMTIVNSLVLGFYDCYLKGEGTFTVQEVY